MGTSSTSQVILDGKNVLGVQRSMDGYVEADLQESWDHLRFCDLDKLTENFRKTRICTEAEWGEDIDPYNYCLADFLMKIEHWELPFVDNRELSWKDTFHYVLDLDKRTFSVEYSGEYGHPIELTFDLKTDRHLTGDFCADICRGEERCANWDDIIEADKAVSG